jgi:hypothetical protein
MQIRRLTVLAVLAACSGNTIPLKEVRDDAFGYVIKVPEEAKQTETGNSRHVWSWTFNDKIDSYHCIIEHEHGLDAFTPENARKRVEMIRKPSDITKVEAQGTDGILVELAEDQQFHYREAFFYRRGKTNVMAAICEGPGKGDTITAMATSLRATQ